MKKLVRSPVIWCGLAISLFYFVLAFTVDRFTLYALLNGIFMGVTVAVIAVYWPMFWRSIREVPFNRTSHLALGIGLVWIALIVSRALSIYTRHSNPELAVSAEAFNNPFVGYVGLLAILGGVFHVSGAGIDSHGKFTRGRNLLLICTIVGAVLAGSVVALQLPGHAP